MEPIIQVSDFQMCYGDFVAVDGISFDVQAGEIFGLLGPNGAGKTSTLECLEGLRQVTRGHLMVAGADPEREGRKLPGQIETAEGQQIKVGTGPGYMDAQGFSLQVGERVQVQGFFEDEELKATQVTRLADGQTITLRDDYGRPAWAGSGKLATERQVAGEALQGQGSRGQGGGGRGGNGGLGQAEVGAWLQVQGTVTSVTSEALVIQAEDGQEITVEGRAWRFVQEQVFQVQTGNSLILTGFYEGEELEIGKIDNATSGQTMLVRDENGRPMWAGGGRWGN